MRLKKLLFCKAIGRQQTTRSGLLRDRRPAGYHATVARSTPARPHTTTDAGLSRPTRRSASLWFRDLCITGFDIAFLATATLVNVNFRRIDVTANLRGSTSAGSSQHQDPASEAQPDGRRPACSRQPLSCDASTEVAMGVFDWFRRKPRAEKVQAAPPQPLRPILAEDVFTPTSSAKRGFIGRGEVQSDLQAALRTPGTQIIVYGESGAGKSSLVDHSLLDLGRKHLSTHCTGATTYTEILASVFDELGVFAISDLSAENSIGSEIGGSIGSDVVAAKIESHLKSEDTQGSVSQPVVKTQLTPQRVEAELAQRQITWIIEDLHKVKPEVKEQVADLLKVFVNRASKRTGVVVLGAAETAGAIVRAPADVKTRVAQLSVKPLTPEELSQILEKGALLLNVDFSEVKDEIIRLSSGVASATHALALRCLQQLGIETPVLGEARLITHDVLVLAARSYARSMSGNMKEDFEKGVFLKRVRKFDNCAVILRAIAGLPERGGTHAEILAQIKESTPGYPAGNLSAFLPQLASDERGGLLRNTPDGRWRYDEPLQHTYAQILFNIRLETDDIFASELLESVSNEQRDKAQAAASIDAAENL